MRSKKQQQLWRLQSCNDHLWWKTIIKIVKCKKKTRRLAYIRSTWPRNFWEKSVTFSPFLLNFLENKCNTSTKLPQSLWQAYMYGAYGRNVFPIIILTWQKAGPDRTLIFCFRGHGSRRGGHGGPPQGGSCTQPRALRGPKGEGEAPSPLGISIGCGIRICRAWKSTIQNWSGITHTYKHTYITKSAVKE